MAQGKNQPGSWAQLKNQVFLGDEKFLEQMHAHLETGKDLREIPARQRRPWARPLRHYSSADRRRDDAIVEVYASGGYSMKEIGDHFGIHYSYVSKILSRAGKSRGKTLCRLLVPNHSPRFWREVARVLPDFEARRAMLHRLGRQLVF